MTGNEVERRPGTGPVTLAAVALAAVAAALGLGLRAEQAWREGAGTVDQVVEIAVEAGAAACAAWIAVGAVVGLAYAAARSAGREWHTGRAFLTRCSPAVVRRLAGVVVTAGVGIGFAAPGAFAAPGPDGRDAPAAVEVIDLGWLPTTGGPPENEAGEAGPARDREDERQPDPPARGDGRGDNGWGDDRPPSEAGTVVVAEGDSLWSIAAAQLAARAKGPGTGPPRPARVARETAAWYAANRDVIGPDPDLVRPGTVLHPPVARLQGARP
ncbi:hypothetical protein [Myceligenerans crystallogenes]|uniref:LysM domain-containing protein n=1 Tax=Myceligenerans crystallogenes TaxID=316335 RepID=A0ABP4ZIB0_9MICO